MTDYIEQFKVEYQDYHRISAKRARQQRQLLRTLQSRLDGRSLVECGAEDFQALLGDLAKGRHPNTVRKLGNMLRPFFNWAYARGYMEHQQWQRLRNVKDPRGATAHSKPKPYTRAELAEFRAQLEERLPLLPTPRRTRRGKTDQRGVMSRWLTGQSRFNRHLSRHAMRLQVEAIVALALHCGLRRGEIFNLTPDDLHYDNEYVVVRGKADANTGEPKIRAVPFTERAREIVKAWLDFRELMRPDHGRTWLRCNGPIDYADPMSFERFEELLPAVVEPGWTLHRFRHTFATERLRAGTPLEIVSETLGHASLQQTLAYAQIVQHDLTREMQRTETRFLEAIA